MDAHVKNTGLGSGPDERGVKEKGCVIKNPNKRGSGWVSVFFSSQCSFWSTKKGWWKCQHLKIYTLYIFLSQFFFRFPHNISRLYSTRPKLAELIHWTQVDLICADRSPRCHVLLVLVLVRNLYFYILLWPHYGLLLIRLSSNKTSVIRPLQPPTRNAYFLASF